MATSRTYLLLIVYAPALVGDDGRPVAVVHAMERAFPGLRLEWTISDEGQRSSLPDRDAWVAQERRDGGFPLLCNGDENFRVMLTAWESPASQNPGGQAQFEVHAKLPLNAAGLAAAAAVLEHVAEGAHAFWGHVTPHEAAVEIARQTSDPVRKPQLPPRGLPALKLSEDLRSPELPHRLGWLNYWSAAAAQAIGVPDPARDAEWLSRSRRTATGGWLVQLTEAPLELDNPTHLDVLLRAYERFPEIGGRVTAR